MEIFIEDSYNSMSAKAFNDMQSILKGIKNPLISPASGASPAGLYKLIVQSTLKTDHWYFVGLDEWVGMNAIDEGSCRWHLDKDLFDPLKVKKDQLCFFDGRATDLQVACKLAESFIEKQEGIDLAIIGLGLNGHAGMNEPGVNPSLHSHLVELHPQTILSAQKYFTTATVLEKGITLGIANLMEAKTVMLIVSGSAKAAIVKKVLEGEISTEVPASLLRKHPGFKVYLDKEAASLLQK